MTSLSSIPLTVIRSQPTNPFLQAEGSGERCSLATLDNLFSVVIPRQLCWKAASSRNGENHASFFTSLTVAHGIAIAHLLSTKPSEIFISKASFYWAYFKLTKKWKKYPTCSLAKVKMKRISRDKSTVSCLWKNTCTVLFDLDTKHSFIHSASNSNETHLEVFKSQQKRVRLWEF